jgi:hypothetical protein
LKEIKEESTMFDNIDDKQLFCKGLRTQMMGLHMQLKAVGGVYCFDKGKDDEHFHWKEAQSVYKEEST